MDQARTITTHFVERFTLTSERDLDDGRGGGRSKSLRSQPLGAAPQPAMDECQFMSGVIRKHEWIEIG